MPLTGKIKPSKAKVTPGDRLDEPVGTAEQVDSIPYLTTPGPEASPLPPPKIDFLSGESPEALLQAARDLSDLAGFAHSVSDNGQNPDKLIDAFKMLLIIQEEEYRTGGGVGGHLGIYNRFLERWGCEPKADPVGFLNTAHRLSLISRDITVQVTSKGSRILGTIHRVLQDWYHFHMKTALEQFLFQSQREMELIEAYEARGYEVGSLNRALSFLERGYQDISQRLYDYIMEGIAIDHIKALLDKYGVLVNEIAQRRKEGFELTLPIIDRVERAKASALGLSFDAMTGVLSHTTGKALAEMNLISKARFYEWLREALSSNDMLEAAALAGDVIMPLYLPAFPSSAQLEEFVADFLGREVAGLDATFEEAEETSTEIGDIDEYEGEFEEDFAPYVDLVLASLGRQGKTMESSFLRRRDSWGEMLMTAAASGEIATKGLAQGEHTRETYEDARFGLAGDIVFERDVALEKDAGAVLEKDAALKKDTTLEKDATPE
ncbi:MAG TPA: hypothetical protein GX529_00695 [Firmicutes bacterium]|nr:hypothetical protein [Candidatus Fermentithermobacillaceae bacterium]